MSLKIKNKKPYLLSLAIIVLCLTFKYFTGSFISIGEKSEMAVIAYEMKKRKPEMTLFALTGSCIDIDQLGKELKSKTINHNNSCINVLVNEQTPNDSVVYILLHKALEFSTYNKSVQTDIDKKTTWIYKMHETERMDSFAVVFRKIDEDYLIANITEVTNYLGNICQ